MAETSYATIQPLSTAEVDQVGMGALAFADAVYPGSSNRIEGIDNYGEGTHGDDRIISLAGVADGHLPLRHPDRPGMENCLLPYAF